MSTRLRLDPADPAPIYAQLERAVRAAVATGHLAAGEQLPTVRQLAVDLRVNANTVARVYVELERAGVVETRRGVGTFVSLRQPHSAPPAERERKLRALEDRFLAEAVGLGFTTPEVVHHLSNRLKKKEIV